MLLTGRVRLVSDDVLWRRERKSKNVLNNTTNHVCDGVRVDVPYHVCDGVRVDVPYAYDVVCDGLHNGRVNAPRRLHKNKNFKKTQALLPGDRSAIDTQKLDTTKVGHNK